MSRSAEIRSASYEGRSIVLYVAQDSTDPVNNRSTVHWALASEGGAYDHYTIAPTTVTINGTVVCSIDMTYYSSHVFPAAKGSVGGYVTVNHDGSGNASIPISLSTAVFEHTPHEYSSTWTLDRIDRGGIITSAQDFNQTGNPVIGYTNPLGESLYSLEACIELGGSVKAAYRAVPKTGTGYTFSLTTSERQSLMNATTNTSEVTFRLRSKVSQSSSYIYSSITKTFTVTETEDTKPTLSVTATPVNTGLPSAFSGKYVKGKSSLQVTLTDSARYGASISSRSTYVNGQTYTGASFTVTDLLPDGTITVTSTVTDSRGFTRTATANFTVYPYAKPALVPVTGQTQVLMYRSNQYGVQDNTSNRIWLKASVSCSSVAGLNTPSLYYRRSPSSAWTAISFTSGTTYDGLLPGTYAITSSFQMGVKVSDTIGETATSDFFIPTQDIPLHLGEGGKSVGIGRYADENTNYSVKVGWDAYFDEDVKLKNGASYETLDTHIANAVRTSILNTVYPVGSIYMSVNPTSPQSFLGGTWTRIQDTFLLAGGTSYSPGTTGGEAAHTLTESELPSHRHALANNGHAWYWGQTSGTNLIHADAQVIGGGTSSNQLTTHQWTDSQTNYTGSGTAHNNMPPYTSVYVWKRTA